MYFINTNSKGRYEYLHRRQESKAMSANTALRITRSKAREYLMQKVVQADDFELIDMLNALLQDWDYKTQIVNDMWEDNDDRWLF